MATFEKNSDGSTVVKLEAPIVLNGEELSRVTIPKLKAKHLFGMTGSDPTSIGNVVQWASTVVEPKGAVEEMSPKDGVEIGSFLVRALRLSPSTGEAPSQ